MKISTGLFARAAVAVAAVAAMSTSCVYAADDTPMASGALRIGSGPDGKLYQLLVRDMQTVCGNEVPVVNVPTVGGIPNLMGLSASQLDLGIVQLDTLQEIGRDGDENIQTLQAVMPLHTNLLHILTVRDGYKVGEVEKSLIPGWKKEDTRETRVVRKFTDLKGLKVAVVGSTMLLGQRLNEQNSLEMNLRKAETDDEAVKLLQDNKVQAIFTDGGWPLPSIARFKSDSGLALVEYNLAPRPPFVVVKRNYQYLDAFNMRFLGSPNLLVTRPFKPGGEMGKRVSILQNCLLKHLNDLQEGRFQAAWKEIKAPTDTLNILRFGKSK
jgi:ABC-type amino acid transport substrate-binding protein